MSTRHSIHWCASKRTKDKFVGSDIVVRVSY